MHIVLSAVLAFALAQSDPSGHWEGTLQAPNGPNRFELDLAKSAKGDWIASLAVPQQNAVGLRVADIAVDGQKLRFTAPEVPGKPKFEFTLAPDKAAGTLSIGETTVPAEMKRTGEAKVQLDPPSPAVSKELEGDWDGALTLPTSEKSRAITLHFRNQPDQTVSAMLDSPSQGAKALLISGVTQNGTTVEFFLRVGGKFKGTLNGTELSGEWRQNPNATPLPLTLKKR